MAGSSRPGGLEIPAIECSNTCPSRLEQGFYLAAEGYRNLVVGMDLVGLPEDDYRQDIPPFVSVVLLEHALTRLRNKYGDAPLKLHAGETHLAARFHHVAQAVELGARRLGHGFALANDSGAQNAVCRYRVPLEISLTSNYQLNLVTNISDHPFRDFYRGKTCGMDGVYFPVTLNTDDAGIFKTDMSKEFIIAVETFDLSWDETKQLALNGLLYGFMSRDDRSALVNRWRDEISALESSWLW